MKIKKCETLLQNITYMALMAAINIIFVLMTTLVPYLLFVLVLVLPLASTVVTLFCKKKYYLIYAVATLGLCCICTIWNISDALFYVLPSLITGFLFGIGIEKGFPPIYLILITGVIQIGFTYLSVPIIKGLLGIDIIQTFINAFNLKDYKYISYLVPMFITFIALTQTTLSYFVISTLLPKLKIDEKNIVLPCFLDFLTVFLINIAALIFAFFVPEVSYTLMLFILFLAIGFIGEMFMQKSTIKLILVGVSAIIQFILFACLYNVIPNPYQMLLLCVFGLLVGIITLLPTEKKLNS